MFSLFAGEGKKRAFRAGKMLFQTDQTQQSVEAKQETQKTSPVLGLAPGSSLRQDSIFTRTVAFPGVWGMARPQGAGLDIQVVLNDPRQVIHEPL